MTNTGQTLRLHRTARGLTLAALADDLGTSQQYLSSIETGARAMSPKLAAKLRDAHPDIWEPVVHAMLHDYATKLGVAHEDAEAIREPLTLEQVNEALELFQRVKRQLQG